MSEQIKPLKVVYCYAHEDKVLREQLENHLDVLKRVGQIMSWHDRVCLFSPRAGSFYQLVSIHASLFFYNYPACSPTSQPESVPASDSGTIRDTLPWA